MKPIRLAWLNISRKRISSLIAALAVAISVACGGVLLRLYELSGSRFDSLAAGPEAIVGAKSGGIEILLGSLNLEGAYPGFLPLKLFESLRARQNVQFEDGASAQPAFIAQATPFLYFARVGSGGATRVIATDETFLEGRSVAEGRWAQAIGEAVIGAEAARRLGLSVGQSIEAQLWLEDAATGPLRAMQLKIVGRLAAMGNAWDRGIFSNLATGREAAAALGGAPNSIWGTDVLNYFLLRLKPGGMKPLIDLVNKRTVGQVVSVEEQRAELKRLTGSGRSLGLLVTSLIIVLAGLCMLTLMLVRFDAMATQIAVLRAIGYLRGEIAAWLLAEGAMLGAAGCLLGAVLDGLLFPSVRALLGTALPDPSIVASSLTQAWPVWIAAMGAVTLAVAFPIWRMYAQDVQASLKG